MARIMELFVIVNAACGIAAFVIAKGMINKTKRKFRAIIDDNEEDNPTKKENSH